MISNPISEDRNVLTSKQKRGYRDIRKHFVRVCDGGSVRVACVVSVRAVMVW